MPCHLLICKLKAINKFKNIKSGDIIYAKRVNRENPNKILPEGHKEGPFLVLENKCDKLLCYQGGSNLESTKWHRRFIVDNKNYSNLTKNTCFSITTYIYEITIDTFIKKLNTLNNYDYHIFRKKINILSKYDDYLKKYIKSFDLEYGDIFKYKKCLYLVYKLEGDMATGVTISDNIHTDYKFVSDSLKIRYIDFSNTIQINKKEAEAIDFIDKNEFNKILVQFKKYLEKEKKKYTVKRGSLINYEDKFIYIYSEEGSYYLGYSVDKNFKYNKSNIIINNKKYSTDFSDMYKLNKNDNYEIISTATEEEASSNTKTKKVYNKSKMNSGLNKTKHKNDQNITSGVIVTDESYMHTEYIVLWRECGELLTIMIDGSKNYFIYLNINEVDFNRKLSNEEFKDILINLSENPNKCNRYISEYKLKLLIDKFS